MCSAARVAVQALARRMEVVSTTRGTHLAEQGDEADTVWFLQRGTIEIIHLGRPVSRLFAPATFGEAALLRDEMDHADTRLSGYRTTGTCMCAFRIACCVFGELLRGDTKDAATRLKAATRRKAAAIWTSAHAHAASCC